MLLVVVVVVVGVQTNLLLPDKGGLCGGELLALLLVALAVGAALTSEDLSAATVFRLALRD